MLTQSETKTDRPSSLSQKVAGHYANSKLADVIADALTRAGLDATPEALGPVDEFHTGGHQATLDLLEQLDLPTGARMLDVGCGIGGPARTLAQVHGCRVHGVDLTADYVAVATALSKRVGLQDSVTFETGNVAELSFETEFDGAVMLHVGMNVPDKTALFAGVRRALKRGAVFGVFDIMRTGPAEFAFPVPWASLAECSFVERPEVYRTHAEASGFTVERERNRRDFAIDFFAAMRQRMAENGPPPIGLHLLMGESFVVKIGNFIEALEAGTLSPVEMILRAR